MIFVSYTVLKTVFSNIQNIEENAALFQKSNTKDEEICKDEKNSPTTLRKFLPIKLMLNIE